MSGTDTRRAWADFWDSGAGGCLPSALQHIDSAQRSMWQSLARSLPKRAEVLDLATGMGAVLSKMRDARPDLKLTGIDSAASLPPAPKGIRLKPGVALEKLPFADRSFDAVTSQFGYEYGDTGAAAPEVKRVLRPGGRFLFAVHQRGGPILSHNVPRRAALQWALDSGWLGKARSLVEARRAIGLPTPPTFAAAVGDARRAFPDTSAAAEFIEAFRRTLDAGRGRPVAESGEVLDTLEAKARNEIARIDSLDRAARDSDGLTAMARELSAAGLAVEPFGELIEPPSRRAFAWILTGTRPKDQ